MKSAWPKLLPLYGEDFAPKERDVLVIPDRENPGWFIEVKVVASKK